MENKKETEVVPLEKIQPESKIDIGDLLSKAGEFLISATEQQNSTNLRIAEINKPITEKQLELQELNYKNQHEAWVKATDAQIAKDKREFTTGSIILGSILLFLMATALILVYKSEYQLALSIITLLIGFIGGYSVDKQKQKNQESG